MGPRGRALLLFFAGVAAWIAFGAVLAAYDLWGGVPRPLWRLMQGLLVGGGLGVLGGGARWILTWPPGQRLRAGLRAALVLAALAAIVGGALLAYYIGRWDSSRATCRRGAVAPALADRHALVAEGLGPLFPVIDPHYECIDLKRALDALEQHGRCPFVPPADAPCRCGADAWEPGASACASGPTTCESRPQGERYVEALGCASEDGAERLAAARAASADAR